MYEENNVAAEVIEDVITGDDETKNPVYIQVQHIAAMAAPEDRNAAAKLVGKASSPGTEIITLKPVVAAILFAEHNNHNRDWRAKESERLARAMQNGEWELNHQGIAFYESGKISDGQHRLAACALSGVEIPISVFYGMKETAIVTVDCGTKRKPSDALMLEGVKDALTFQTIVTVTNAYEIKAKVDGVKRLETSVEVANEVKANLDKLRFSVAMAAETSKGIAKPVIPTKSAAQFIYLLTRNNWEPETIRTLMVDFQTGISESGDTPLFKVAQQFAKADERKARAENLSVQKKLALMVYAFKLEATGKKAVTSKQLQEAVKTFSSPVL